MEPGQAAAAVEGSSQPAMKLLFVEMGVGYDQHGLVHHSQFSIWLPIDVPSVRISHSAFPLAFLRSFLDLQFQIFLLFLVLQLAVFPSLTIDL